MFFCFFVFIHMIWKHRQHSEVKRSVCVKLFIYMTFQLIYIFSVIFSITPCKAKCLSDLSVSLLVLLLSAQLFKGRLTRVKF